MSFSGDLEHLPIVDLIQLLHSTRKTGTLCLKSAKGESQLVFNDGYFISANHVNNSVRIGQILVGMKAITPEELENALLEQKNAGPKRKPLVATLIEKGQINKEDAYKGLEELIEMTIVEVLTWKAGTFSLDVTKSDMSDEYHYFPETLQQEIFMNAQSILMDALRIYDEKMRDGTLSEVFFPTEESGNGEELVVGDAESITADLLGLDELEKIEKKIPSVFTGLRDQDPFEEHRRIISEELGEISQEESDRLCAILTAFSRQIANINSVNEQQGPALAIVLYSRDNFISHAIKSICHHEKIFIFSTDEEINLDMIIEQSMSRDLLPILVIDAVVSDDGDTKNTLDLLNSKKQRFRQLSVIHTIYPPDFEFSLQLLEAGVQAILPRPCKRRHKETFVDDTIIFLSTFQSYLRSFFTTSNNLSILKNFKNSLLELDTLAQPPEVASLLLNYVSSMFERSITFVVGKMELIAEKGVGIKADKSAGATPPMMFKIPLDQPSVFKEVVTGGSLFYDNIQDAMAETNLFQQINKPHNNKILLLPIKSFGRVIAVIYADFGSKDKKLIPVDLLDVLARHASLVLDHAFYRKRFEKPAQAQ